MIGLIDEWNQAVVLMDIACTNVGDWEYKGLKMFQ